ncbi:MAG TPA: DUF6786 family protein [Cyclobacteriaceae bacterium]|nr:DUF6786 family protein [Cyclobacteriaceae bacterium]
MKSIVTCIALTSLFAITSCKNKSSETKVEFQKGTYGYDSTFLAKYDSTFIELKDESGSARLIISPFWQGRVMTSTSTGPEGASYGWINYDLLASGEKKAQFNPVGGEERFWLGPEGGQFSIYFAPGDTFNIKSWQVPAAIDTIPWKMISSSGTQAMFGAEAYLKNYTGTDFNIFIERRVRLLRPPETESVIGTHIPQGVQAIGYETHNKIENKLKDIKKETGLLSVWLLGMLTPSDSTTVIIPFHPQENAQSLITTNYFGDIPSDRLQIKDSVLYFRCDGKYRSKIGLPPTIAKPIAASFDYTRNILTIINFPVDETGMYVNSKWEIQKEPYKGDVVNSYNDGPLADGSQLGPFYELESSSSVKELKVAQSMNYIQVTCHFEGDYEGLKELAKKILGVDLDELNK